MSANKQHRSLTKSKLTRIQTYIENNPLDRAQPVQQYESRLTLLDEAFISFTELHLLVVAELDQDITEEQHEEYYVPVEEAYLETKSNLQIIIETLRSVATQQQQLLVQQQQQQLQQQPLALIPKIEIKLPRLSLPTFSGDYSEWTTFFDLFKCSVDQNTSLTNAQKLQYLKSVLKGEALQLIQHFSISDDNYAEAWDKLQQRYNKKKHIIYNFIKNFTELPSVAQQGTGRLRQLTSTADVILRGITALGYESRDPWIIYLLLQKMDSETQSMWSLESTGNDEPTQAQFFTFLEKRCDALESVPQKPIIVKPNISKSIKTHTVNQSTSQQPPSSINSFYQATPTKCAICPGEHHYLHQCNKFKTWNVTKKREFVNKNRYCFNCLNQSHLVQNCNNKYSCIECKKRHHSLLHIDSPSGPSPASVPSTSQATPRPQKSSNAQSFQVSPSLQQMKIEVTSPQTTTDPTVTINHIGIGKIGILPTAIVNAIDIHGKIQEIRVLLDSAADSSLITESCMKRLQLTRTNGRRPLTGVAAVEAGTTKGLTKVTLLSRLNKDCRYDIEAYVLPKLTANIPSETLHLSDWDVIHSVHLADPGFAKPEKIDMIIGTDFFMSLLRPGQIDSKDGRPIVTNTVFGWVISGKIRNFKSSLNSSPIQTLHVNIDESLRKFWELEEVQLPPQQTEDEIMCENHFNSSFTRNDDGRFTVRLPFNNNTTPLGTSIFKAISRMKAMERRFQNDQYFMEEYIKFMDEYLELNHMEEVPEEELKLGKYYLPHHAVIKESSTSTKHRVVYDASSKSSSGISLNDKLLVGPTLQDDLFTTIVRFRTHKYVFTADIAKMYRQIRMHDLDTDYQRIIFRKSNQQPFKHYRLKTVTYGTASAPYLATKVIQQVGKDATDEFPEAAKIILRDFYVDDLMTGGDDLQQTQQLQQQIINILQKSGFDLRKWSSNNEALLSTIPKNHREVDLVNLDDDSQSIKALGLHWQPFNDIFTFQVHVPPITPLTKRIVLSDASKLFDPLGLVSPTIVKAKMFLQELWLLKLDWDDKLSSDIEKRWQQFRSDLIYLEQVKIKRWIPNSDSKIELHGFCDASELAYGAVIYARCTDSTGKYHTNIITSKNKIAPLKQISIPRLELCGAVLLCRLMNKVKQALAHLEITGEYLWTDSMIVLSWLAAPPRRWQTFVANRTSEVIQSYPSNKWNHIKSSLNPADLTSRGVAAYELIDNDFWWYGPTFLSFDLSTWFNSVPQFTTVECPEEKKQHILALNNQLIEPKLDLLSKYSCLTKLARITAWCLRFINNSRHPQDKIKGLLSVSELDEAFNIYIKDAQRDVFNDEIQLLGDYKSISPKSKLITLHPFLDLNGLLRVGGRLENSQLSYSTKHQIILPKDHKFTTLLVRTKHIQHLHANTTLLSSILLQQFWIIGLKNLVRKTIHKCILCFRHKAQAGTQLMGNLPASRIIPSRVFSNVGVDYAGPVLIKLNKRKNSPTEKAYIALFICMVTKAIHLEAVTSLTSEAFIAALKRFVSRRGNPSNIYSDNGTNFVGANRQLKELHQMLKSQMFNDAISHFLTINGTNWHFNPPSAPHFGGLWEAGVKSVKFHLKRILINTATNFEELTTILATIEACLNSRPLCVLSSDPHAPRALTPGHFLIQEELTAVPEPDLAHIEMNRLDRWQFIQKLTNDFWKRWSREYLSSLQQRNKWTTESPDIKENDVVLVKEDNVPSAKWILGIVKETFPGADGKTRVVTLEQNNKQFQRPIHKLCLLPLN